MAKPLALALYAAVVAALAWGGLWLLGLPLNYVGVWAIATAAVLLIDLAAYLAAQPTYTREKAQEGYSPAAGGRGIFSEGDDS